ncbi:hypothetical protein [Bacteriovorax sp. Seq25_V]|uniref:hypothetical protein n=1 Tax=Bacteriovorax sp. Seq25_V TaxID=1201288 RepID=UPI000389E680|nr:hypothetical protein [Bacteriovorax sp. Seq25_V]EQC44912.1 hypothetical protein M900_A0101 [Bacteriovorax sp. Seq25_V]
MAKRKKQKQIFRYDCTMTGETYKTTREAPSPDDLVSVQAYYELNPEEDDRPADIKKELGVESSDS